MGSMKELLSEMQEERARALLIHPDKLAAYQQHAAQLVRNPKDKKGLLDPKWFEQAPDIDTPAYVYRLRAKALVGRVTFQTERVIHDHFSLLLATPFDWPLEPLKPVVTTRNDLVHRNGITAFDEPFTVWPGRVEHAIRCIHDIVEAAGATLLQEETIVAGWGVQPVPHTHHPEGEQ